MKPILHLNLKKKWFDMIVSGEKKEEYRDITAYWARRFSIAADAVIICFSNGYAKNRPQVFVECTDLHIGIGKKEWGASGKEQFILSLGKIHDNRHTNNREVGR